MLKGGAGPETSLRDCPGTVEACREPDGRRSLDEREEVTLRAIRSAVPLLPQMTTARSIILERRERRETPMTTVRLTAPVRDRATLTVLNGVDPGRAGAGER